MKKTLSPYYTLFLAGIIAFVVFSCNSVSKKEYTDPETLWAELYYHVQADSLFTVPKEFWDAAPKGKAENILQTYRKEKTTPGFSLSAFIAEHFSLPDYSQHFAVSDTSFEAYVTHAFRALLTRPKDDGGSLIPTRMRYLSGGGMFPEYNYFQSFFAVKAFQSLGEDSLAADMATNAFQFIQDYGYVPYGNRSYYLGFSGFPMLSLMAEAVAEKQPELLPWFGNLMARDYQTQMAADGELPPSGAYQSVVVLKDNGVLNRFYSEGKENRYISLLKTTEWEGSGRFLVADTQHPDRFLPIDLNAALYHFEKVLAASFLAKKRPEYAESYTVLANNRKEYINHYLYDPARGFYYDYDFISETPSDAETLAAIFPLLTGLSTGEQAQAVIQKIENNFLTDYGVKDDLSAPDGSAEMNYLTILALRKADRADLADLLKSRWLKLNREYFSNNGHILPVYNLKALEESRKTPQRIDGALAILTALLNE